MSLGNGFMHVHERLLTIVQMLSYIPGGPLSLWKSLGLLLSVIAFAIALLLIWAALRWVAKKLAAASRKKYMRAYQVRPRKDKRGINLTTDALPLGRLCAHCRIKVVCSATVNQRSFCFTYTRVNR